MRPFGGTQRGPAVHGYPLVGIQQCLNDGWFTIRHLNEGFHYTFRLQQERDPAGIQEPLY